MRRQLDPETLTMALRAYQAEAQKIDAAMHAIRQRIGGRAGAAVAAPATNGARAKRRISAAALKRISAAQKKRWAAFHAKQKAAKAVAPKRTLSSAAKAKLVANLAKARAAKAAKAAPA